MKPAVIEFVDAAHRYKLNGKAVPSVTQVLDWALSKFDMVPPEILEAARVFGSHVHQMVDLFNVDDLDEGALDPRLSSYLAGYKKFLSDTGFRVELSEKRVGSVKFGYCGMLDLFGNLKGKAALMDVKSTATLPRTVGPQTAAYLQGLIESTPKDWNPMLRRCRRFCLHLKPEGYKLVELTGAQDFTWFQSCLNCYRWWHSPAVC